MGKLIAALVFFALAGLGGYYLVHLSTADQGYMLGTAMSEADEDGVIQFQVLVPMMQTAKDPPLAAIGPPDWQAWLDDHYVLTDAAGNRVDLKKGGSKSKDIGDSHAGSSEFVALADVEQGKRYALEITDVVGEPEKYVYEFTAEPMKFRRPTYRPNY